MKALAGNVLVVVAIALVAYLFRRFLGKSSAATSIVQVRRARVRQKHQDIDLRAFSSMGTSGQAAIATYQVTFEITESGELQMFYVTLDQFSSLEQGMSGTLTSKGRWYVGFEAEQDAPADAGGSCPE
jgi:hypothetical protein